MALKLQQFNRETHCASHRSNVQGESKKTDSFEMQISRTKSHWYKTYQISALLIDLRQKSNSLWKLKSF